ncbi:uncharacterized protein LY79DRAFT_665174 [Colletotrichum navitas]|uniref:Uncharacterized protein n=1 Tax=Colletotrichum navitas TaxID=681940 RepID=A0AAD8QBJ1_9PEZI|nr:uncharacterized protein LY79DRAFT_665174 [Colletotrichum navitas]KAK1599512.1 hypothetical protein LY79DRAFT_665174 [Colletotrichum navitas]
MKYTFFTLITLLAWAFAAPQDPQVPLSTSVMTLIVTGPPAPVSTEPISNNPDPLPAPVSSVPIPSDPSQPAPPSGGPHCVCGATYCGKILVRFQGYTTEQVGQGYCSTNGTNCASAAPAPESLQNALFVCICPAGQKEGSTIELICPCQGVCKNDEPDFIARCESACGLGCAPTAPAPSSFPVPVPLPVPISVEPAPVQSQPIPSAALLAKKRA